MFYNTRTTTEEALSMKIKFGKAKGPEWPSDDNGQPVPPAHLKRVFGGPLDLEMEIGLLAAYGIPHVSEYPNNGAFGKIIMGHPPGGMEIYVPETMLEDAQNILNAEIDDEESDDEEEADNTAEE